MGRGIILITSYCGRRTPEKKFEKANGRLELRIWMGRPH